MIVEYLQQHEHQVKTGDVQGPNGLITLHYSSVSAARQGGSTKSRPNTESFKMCLSFPVRASDIGFERLGAYVFAHRGSEQASNVFEAQQRFKYAISLVRHKR